MKSSIVLSEFVILKVIKPYTECGKTVVDIFVITLAKLRIKRVSTIRQNERKLPKAAK